MSDNRVHGFRRCDPFPSDDLSISLQQLAAIGQPHRSIREMLAGADQPTADGRQLPAH